MSLPGVRRGIVLAIVAMLVTTAGAEPASAMRVVHRKKVADGVHYTVLSQRKPPIRARVVAIRESARPSLSVALGAGRLPGLERTSSMARRSRALVAINGDYARRSGRPVMTFARNGRMVQTPLTAGANFGIGPDGFGSYIGYPRLGVSVQRDATKERFQVGRVNNGPPAWRQLALYTPTGGNLEKPPLRACSARLYPKGGVRLRDQGGLEATYEVDRIRCSFRRMWPRGGVILAGRAGSARGRQVRAMSRGERVVLSWALGSNSLLETLGGNPMLVQDGRIVVSRSGQPFFRRHPRTGIGMTRDGRVLLVAVDGRRRRYSRGMTLRRFARLFRSLGAVRALNLDGGGSTTMVVRGRVVNRPSDGRERPVSSAVLVLARRTDLVRKLSRVSEPLAHEGLSRDAIAPAIVRGPAIWGEMASDPASTGGMSAAIKRHRRLPSDLKDAARRVLGDH